MRVSLVALAMAAAALAAPGACGGTAGGPPPSFADLRARPLPRLSSGGCHTDGVVDNLRQFRFDATYLNFDAQGSAPVVVSGPRPGLSRVAPLEWRTHGYAGPILIRLRRLDQPGTGAVWARPGPAPTSGNLTEEDVPPGAADRSWSDWAGVPAAGCWGFQVDTAATTELIVFEPLPAPASKPPQTYEGPVRK